MTLRAPNFPAAYAGRVGDMKPFREREDMERLDLKTLTAILGQASMEKKVYVQASSIGYDDYWKRVLELLEPYLKDSEPQKGTP